MECLKCGKSSGDDWSQCKGVCPMASSPHFDKSTCIHWTNVRAVAMAIAEVEFPGSSDGCAPHFTPHAEAAIKAMK